MNITVTITVDLNVLQNASKCTISKEKIPKFFWGGGTPPSPDSTPVGASIRVPLALEPPPNHMSGYGPVHESWAMLLLDSFCCIWDLASCIDYMALALLEVSQRAIINYKYLIIQVRKNSDINSDLC